MHTVIISYIWEDVGKDESVVTCDSHEELVDIVSERLFKAIPNRTRRVENGEDLSLATLKLNISDIIPDSFLTKDYTRSFGPGHEFIADYNFDEECSFLEWVTLVNVDNVSKIA
jgi:hypothetical protein